MPHDFSSLLLKLFNWTYNNNKSIRNNVKLTSKKMYDGATF